MLPDTSPPTPPQFLMKAPKLRRAGTACNLGAFQVEHAHLVRSHNVAVSKGWGPFVGLIKRALLCGVYILDPNFWKLPNRSAYTPQCTSVEGAMWGISNRGVYG